MFTQLLTRIHKQLISSSKQAVTVHKQKKFAVTVTWQDGRIFESYCLGMDMEDAIEDMKYRNSYLMYARYRENQIVYYGTVVKLELGKELE